MKITASKKTIVILSISFILLLLVAGLSFFYRDIISNGFKYGRWFVLDKYEELLDDCDYVKTKDTVEVKCKGLLYPPQELDKRLMTHCYNFITIPKKEEDKTFVFNICEGNNRVKWEGMDEWLEVDSFLPLKYSIIYSKSKLFTFEYSSLEIANVSDTEYYEEFYKNKDIAQTGFVVSLENATSDDYYNYVVMKENTFGIEEAGHIYTFTNQLQNIETKGDILELTFKSTIEGKDVIFTLPSRQIEFSEGEDLFTTITVENKDLLKVGGNYQLQFFFLTDKSDTLVENLKKECNREEVPILLTRLCGNIDIVLSNSFKPTTKDKIIEEILSGANKKDLQNTILFYMISVEK